MYKNYIDYLNKEFSSDYWSDLGVVEAMDLLDDFDEQDWAKLENEISKLSPEVQVRCAETLAVYSKEALEISKVLIQSEHASVVIAAIDSLSSMSISMDKDIFLANAHDLSLILTKVKSSFKFSELECMVINSFDNKLSKVL